MVVNTCSTVSKWTQGKPEILRLVTCEIIMWKLWHELELMTSSYLGVVLILLMTSSYLGVVLILLMTSSYLGVVLILFMFIWFCSFVTIKRVVIETTGVCDVTLRPLRYTWPIGLFFPKRSGRIHRCLYRHQ